MKKFLIFSLVFELGIFGYGAWLHYVKHDSRYHFYFGLFTLLFFLVTMPVFLWWRYKDKDLTQWQLRKRDDE